MSTDPASGTPEPAPAPPQSSPSPAQADFAAAGASPHVAYVEGDRPCASCSYNLKGLPISGACPECGKPVEFSLRGILLQFASPEYLAVIRSGASLVLNGILILIAVSLLSVAVAIIAAAGLNMRNTRGTWVELAITLVQLVPTAMIMLGYWRFTQPDPGFAGLEKPDSARSVIRVAVVVQAVFQVFHVLTLLAGATFMPAGTVPYLILNGLVSLISLVAWAVQFFAMMQYLKWLAKRLPDSFITSRAGTYMWLLPVLYTVGSLACGIGPLVALVLYWNLLDRVRKHIKAIIFTGHPAILPNTTL